MPLACVVCADDFALTDGVSRAILDLLGSGHISATGAMTNRPGWSRWGRELMAFAGKADLGVHLNLTAGSPLTKMPLLAPNGRFPGLGDVMRKAVLSSAVRREIEQEFAAQIARFGEVFGRTPDFIDGHQHVHAMPGIGPVTLALRAGEKALASAYVRDPTDTVSAITARGVATGKALLVTALAGAYTRHLRERQLPTNRGFSGFSGFDPLENQLDLIARQAKQPGDLHLIMCHPGEADDPELTGLDPVAATRPLETIALREADRILRPVRFETLRQR